MQLKATVDVSEAVAGLDELQHKSLPFALAKTLTGCARAGQRKVQDNLGNKFELKNNFTKQGIRIKPAEKYAADGVMQADVHTYLDTHTHPDYMLPQEEGAEKVPWGGHHYIAVPTRYLFRIAGRIPPPELRIGSIMANIGDVYENGRRIRGLDHAAKTGHALVFFVQEWQGHKYVFARYYQMRQAMPIYLLIPDAHIKPVLEMERDVDEAVQASFPALWQENWRQIMARGLRITP
jgi:hypothetical protein